MTAIAHDIERAADAVRAANHSTMRSPLTVPETYTVLGNLVDLAHRLPEVLDFLARSACRADPAEHFDDRLTNPTDALYQVLGDLAGADHDLDQLARHLTSAHNHLGHLGRHTPED